MLIFGFLVGTAGLTIIFIGYTNFGYSRNDPKSTINNLERKIQKNPYDSSTLLETSRYIYRTVRKRLQAGRPAESLQPLIRKGLRYYRRIVSNPEWKLDRKDYFYMGFLYYKFGPMYYDRARAMALKSYHRGYRSRPLLTLLANVHYHQADSKKDLQVALNFYNSLGSGLRDPVLLYNKAEVLRALGETSKALKLLKRGEKYFETYPEKQKLFSRYRLSTVQLRIEEGNYRKALDYIKSIPENKRSLKLKTLFAQCLIELGHTSRARTELSDVVKHNESPRKAEKLLGDLTGKSSETGS